MHVIKRKFFSIILVCCAVILFGCGNKIEKQKVFDFSRYYEKSFDVFLKDFDLTEEDFYLSSYGHTSNDPLPFMDYEGIYHVTFGERDKKILHIKVDMIEKLDKAESLYEKALEIMDVYESIETAKCYFDSFDEVPPAATKIFQDPDGNEVETTTQMGTYLSIYDIRQYTSYEDFNEVKDIIDNHVVGIWNLEDSVQVKLYYSENVSMNMARIEMEFYNSTSQFASPFGEK